MIHHINWSVVIVYAVMALMVILSLFSIVLGIVTWDDRVQEARRRYRLLNGIPECDNCQDCGMVSTDVPGRAAPLVSFCYKNCPAAQRIMQLYTRNQNAVST